MDKIPYSVAQEWLKHPVTIAYLEAVASFNNDEANYIASGKCVSNSPEQSTSDLYHMGIGKLQGIQKCFQPLELMVEQDLVSHPSEQEIADVKE